MSLARFIGRIAQGIPQKHEPKDKRKVHQLKKEAFRKSRFSIPWQSEATVVIKEKLKHYEETGNENKASIYRMKLQAQPDIFEKIKSLGQVFQ